MYIYKNSNRCKNKIKSYFKEGVSTDEGQERLEIYGAD